MKSPFLKYLFIFFMFLYPFSMHAQGNIKSKKSSRNPPLKFIESIVLATSASQKINEEEKTSVLINKQEEIKNDQVDAIENLASIQFRYAQILDVAVEEMVNIYLYQFVDDWLNIHYKFGGTSKEGIDCSGFSSVLYNSIFSIQFLAYRGHVAWASQFARKESPPLPGPIYEQQSTPPPLLGR